MIDDWQTEAQLLLGVLDVVAAHRARAVGYPLLGQELAAAHRHLVQAIECALSASVAEAAR